MANAAAAPAPVAAKPPAPPAPAVMQGQAPQQQQQQRPLTSVPSGLGLPRVGSAVSLANPFESFAPQLRTRHRVGEHYEPRAMTRFAVEFIGTFFIGLMQAMVVGYMHPFTVAGAYIAVTYMGAHSSKGQFNPAITLSYALYRAYENKLALAGAKQFANHKNMHAAKMKQALQSGDQATARLERAEAEKADVQRLKYLAKKEAVFMPTVVVIMLQLLGGALGVAMGAIVLGQTEVLPAPQIGHTVGEALTAEIVFTATLIHIYMLSLVAKGNMHAGFFGLAMGLTLLGGKGAAQHISGAVFNPAIAVGLILSNADSVDGKNVWIYVVAPIVASVVGLLPFTLEEYVSYTHGRSWQRKLSKLMSEFWGTGVVVYTAALTQGTGNALPTLSIGAMLVGQTYGSGFVSGAQFNPAVTLSWALTYGGKENARNKIIHFRRTKMINLIHTLTQGPSSEDKQRKVSQAQAKILEYSDKLVVNRPWKIVFIDVVLYWVFQFGAALFAGAVAAANLTDGKEPFPAPLDTSTAGVGRAFLLELLLSTVFVYLFLCLTANSNFFGIFHFKGYLNRVPGNWYYGLAIGFSYFALVLASDPIYGIALNPALGLGLAVAAGVSTATKYIPLFLFTPLLGGILASLLFRITNERDCAAPKVVEDRAVPTRNSRGGRSNRRAPLRLLISEHVPVFQAVKRPLFEFVATFALALTASLLSAGTSGEIGLAIGALVIGLQYAGRRLSKSKDVVGGLFNPTATFAVWLTKRDYLRTWDACIYCFVQMAGGLLGAALGAFISGSTPYAAPEETDFESMWREYLLLVFLGFIVSISVLASTTLTATMGNDFSGIAYGFATAAITVAMPGFTKSLANPAVGTGLIAANGSFEAARRLWLYLFTPSLGAVLAAGVIWLTNYDEWVGRDKNTFKSIRTIVHELWGSALLTIVTAISLHNQYKLAPFAIGGFYMVAMYSSVVYDDDIEDGGYTMVSGGLFNPVFTIFVHLQRLISKRYKVPILETVVTLLAQVVGCIIGAAIVAFLLNDEFAFTVTERAGLVRGFFTEFACTFILLLTLLNVLPETYAQNNNSYFGVSMGFMLVAATAAAFPVSQACFNPAVAIGLAIVNGTKEVATDLWLYLVAPLVAGALAFAFFYFANREEYTKTKKYVERHQVKELRNMMPVATMQAAPQVIYVPMQPVVKPQPPAGAAPTNGH